MFRYTPQEDSSPCTGANRHEFESEIDSGHIDRRGDVPTDLCIAARKHNAGRPVGRVSRDRWRMGNLCFVVREVEIAGEIWALTKAR
jgi:hypothetical protein